MGDELRQGALADVCELASLLHALRGLAGEVESLLATAIKAAHEFGLSQAIIAEGAGLSRGRVHQVLKEGEESSLTSEALHRRTYQIIEWPGEALQPYQATFTGRMTMPPYRRRRASVSQ